MSPAWCRGLRLPGPLPLSFLFARKSRRRGWLQRGRAGAAAGFAELLGEGGCWGDALHKQATSIRVQATPSQPLPSPLSLKSNAPLWRAGAGARKEQALPVPDWKKPATAESGAAEICLQPGKIGVWRIRAGKDRGQAPSCWDVRASCFFLPAVL